MGEVVGVGATIHAPSAEEYRDQLRSWSREAAEAGDMDEVWTDAQIEAWVASRRDAFDVSVALFAELNDGTRVETGEVADMTISGGYAYVGPTPRPFEHLTPESVSAEALEDWRAPETGAAARWNDLCYALAETGVEATPAELQVAPFRVEFTDALLERIAQLRAIPPREE
jgi:hypothetical protein